jgi:hypothetical protein
MKLLFVLLLTGCAVGESVKMKQDLEQNKFYKRDMIVTVNGATVEGVGVFPQASVYNFDVESRGNLDLFVLESCHRSMEKERAWNVTKTVRRVFWKKKITEKRRVQFQYRPTEIEKDYCPIRLSGYEKARGRHSWAFIDFEDKVDTLKAVLRCNGVEEIVNGSSVCQSRQGFIQEIEFDMKVAVDSSQECLKGLPQVGTKFQIALPKRECVFIFMNKKQNSHRLTTVGYEDILIRSVE